MSSTSRAPGDKPEADEPQSKRPASPGRYSLSTEGSTQMAAVRIDSTRMLAVRPDAASPPDGARAAPDPPPMPPAPPAPPASSKMLPASAQAPPSSAQVPLLPRKVPPKGSGAAALASARPQPLPPPAMPAPAMPPASLGPPPARVSLTPPPGSTPGSTPGANVKVSRLPPPPPPRRDSRLPPATASTFPGFDEGSIAYAFDALLSEGTTGLEGRHEVDLAPVRELFAELAASYMRHVRDFMIDVKWGEAPREWIEICVPAVSSLRLAAERLDLDSLVLALEAFGAVLADTAGGTARTRTIEGPVKDRLLEAYEKLVLVLPQAFALDRDKSQREAVIIQSLCLSVPDVRKVTIDKLHAAGLTGLATLFDAKADEVAQVAGIPEALAQRIVERFQAYRRELQNASPQDARAAERERLAMLTARLREQHDGYEEASRGWSSEAKAKKRDLIRGREETWLAISLLLARFGEVERLQGIEKVPFAQRIAQLTDWLDEARDRYRSD